MFGSIDCAGILKLRNADIELRKGETDIGRKNTRVRLVFRVHIPESNGRIISLQAASNPIECCKYRLRFVPSLSLATTIILSLCSRLALRGKNPTCSDRQIQRALLFLCRLGLCHPLSDLWLLPLPLPKQALAAGGSSPCLELVRTARDFRAFANFISVLLLDLSG